jgi:hypothetical protein
MRRGELPHAEAVRLSLPLDPDAVSWKLSLTCWKSARKMPSKQT